MTEKAKPSDSRPLAHNKHHYRFALCGGPDSGKTCILAALAMPRRAHPAGLTVTLVPPSAKSSELERAGYAWVKDGVTRIQAGGVPRPNPNEALRLHLRYRAGDGRNRDGIVEILDYSGELMREEAAVGDLAGELRSLLGKMDGLIILAEHPRREESVDELSPTLNNLASAFALLQQEKLQAEADTKPIALLINKWDRAGTLNTSESTRDQAGHVTKFLDSSSPHTRFLDGLRPASGGHLKVFPVSAFGPAEIVEITFGKETNAAEKIERPVSVGPELHSFGVEDPFVWLMEVRDRIDLQKLDTTSKQREAWWNPVLLFQNSRLARNLHRRISPLTEEGKIAKGLYRKVKTQITAFASAVAVVVSLSVALTLKLEQTRDDHAWGLVESLPDLPSKAEGAERYLKKRPNGRHYEDANKFLLENEIAIKREVVSQWLLKRSEEILKLKERLSQADEDSLPALESDIQKFKSAPPHWELTTEAQRQKFREQEEVLGQLEIEVVGRRTADETRRKFVGLMSDGELEKAADFALTLDNAKFGELLEKFRNQILNALERKAVGLNPTGANWKLTEEKTVSIFKQPKYDPLMPAGFLAKLESLRQKIYEDGDRYMYQQCKDHRKEEICRDYLQNAPICRMRSDVEGWLEYQRKMTTPCEIKVQISGVTWRNTGAGYFDDLTTVKIFIKDAADKQKNLGSNSQEFTTSSRDGHWNENLGTVVLNNVAPTAPISLTIQVWDSDGTWESLGEWSDDVTPSDLAAKNKIRLECPNYGPNDAHVLVSGIPGKPNFRDWQQQP